MLDTPCSEVVWSVLVTHSVSFPFTSPPVRHRVITFQLDSSSCACRWVDCVWNVMAHAQKPDFVFRRNGRVYLNRRGASVQSTTGSRGVHISGSNAGYTKFRGSVKSTGYTLQSSVSPSIPLLWVTVCHHISTWLCFVSKAWFILEVYSARPWRRGRPAGQLPGTPTYKGRLDVGT